MATGGTAAEALMRELLKAKKRKKGPKPKEYTMKTIRAMEKRLKK